VSGDPRPTGRLHTTRDYHLQDLATLGWEWTVCNSLAHPESLCRKALEHPDSYGNLLCDFLALFLDLNGMRRILEVGGGYGVLLRDFLRRCPELTALCIDLSPVLLERQREELAGYPVEFQREDFLETPRTALVGFDLAVLNENLGDLPVVLDVLREITERGFAGDAAPGEAHAVLERVQHFCDRYGLEAPEGPAFPFNLGACEVLEKLCLARIPAIFLSEHSCEARVPQELSGLIRVSAPGRPERIPLMGHDEYTIRFSHLEGIARYHGYRVRRGPLADYLPVVWSDRLRAILRAPAPRSDEEEVLRHFLGDLYQYEYLLLIRGKNNDRPTSRGARE
jgi:SAM-dependent methyltransferase